MARPRRSKGLRTYTEPGIFGPVTVTEVSATPEQLERFERFLEEKAARREKGRPSPVRAAPKRMTREQRTALALDVRDACIPLAQKHGMEKVAANTPVSEVVIGRFLIWFTAWSHDVTGLDLWYAAEGGEKLMRMVWSGDEIDISSFKRPGEWVPELLALVREKMGVYLH
jgi:hypothetical protein